MNLPNMKYRGFALVITLLAIILVSALILVFFSTSQLQRQVSFSSLAGAKSDFMGQAALNIILHDLQKEIEAGSTNLNTGSGWRGYEPTAPGNLLPCPVAHKDSSNSVIQSIVKISRTGEAFWKGSGYQADGPARAVASSTVTPGRGGRYLQRNLWDSPRIATREIFSKGMMSVPDWVIVTARGVAEGATAPLKDLSDPKSNQHALGRFAYVIYNTSGLLESTVAGYHHSNDLSATELARKGSLAAAELVSLPRGSGFLASSEIDSLVGWRNPASYSTGYSNLIRKTGPDCGYLEVANGDQTFVNRRDLIRYWQSMTGVDQDDALQYLTVFSRSADRPHLPALAPNPALTTIRVKKAFTRLDGSPAKVGEPLVIRRFDLRKLSLVQYDSIADASSELYRYFGLLRTDASQPWSYDHGAGGGKVYTLDEVANLSSPREPDFFELLQAGIVSGSTGGSAVSETVTSGLQSIDAKKHLHILTIGANIIDQADVDGYPTEVQDGTSSDYVYGSENLPYLMRIFHVIFRPTGTDTYKFFYVPEIWNPHQNVAQYASDSSKSPTEFRLRAAGPSKGSVQYKVYSNGAILNSRQGPIADMTGRGSVTFSLGSADSFRSPTLLTPDNASSPVPENLVNDPVGKFLGLNSGEVAYTSNVNSGRLSPSAVTFILDYKDAKGNYRPYARMRRTNLGDLIWNGNGPGNVDTGKFNNVYFLADKDARNTIVGESDPRADRFGASLGWINKNGGYVPGALLRTDSGTNYIYKDTPYSTATDENAPLGLTCENKSGSALSYTDPDGKTRLADGGNASSANGNPFTDVSSRPIVLNRPFVSVAELGYTFRDQPWKTLDFNSADSGDAGLLELFSVGSSLYRDEKRLLAGRVNPNTAPAPVLESIFSQALVQENDKIATTEAKALAQQVINRVQTKPFVDRAGLVTEMAWTLSSSKDAAVKLRREAMLRALAEVSDMGTWNLMIDLVAQTGRYPKGASSLDDFLVEGERHYWIHVAIDRFSGEVLHQTTEMIYE